MKKATKFAGLLIVMALWVMMIAGCSSARVYTDAVEGIDYTKYKSYAWLPVRKDTSGKMYNNDIVIQNLQKEVNSELKERGYLTNAKKPDLLVLLHLNYTEVKDTQTYPLYGSYNYYYPTYIPTNYGVVYYYDYNTVTQIYGYGQEEINYTEGKVVVDIIEAKTKKLIWRGWSEREIYPETVSADLTQDVQSIFNKFPVKKVKTLQ
ncbi:MAG: DUF4136 domain-containing protein [Chitinophagales bacterium]|nr:DUF4136 domain-containing protein [Chitinophagales bacterium]